MSSETRDANVRLSAEVDPYARSMQQAAVETDKLALSVDKLVSKLDGLTRRAGKKLALFGAAGAAGVTALGVEAASFEKKLSVLNATAEITNKSMAGTTKTIRDLSKGFPIARDEVIGLVTTLDKLGVSSQRNLRLVADSAIKLSSATGEDLGGLATQLVELQKQMGTLNAGTMDVFANSLLQVSKNAGVSASGVLAFASAVAPAARAADMSQASVLGVSAAFTRAGQDGYAAANTFNSMLSDITRQVVSGSPEISKYANLIGVTSEQFKRMDKGNAVASIFEAISKQGPDAIKTLDRLGYDGVRALKSIQAVSQSGGLKDAIATATGAYSTTDALERGSQAANKGLSDELEKTRNAMQDITTNAGTPFLKVMTDITHGFNMMLAPIEPLVAGLAKLTAGVSGFLALGALGLGGSMMMGRFNQATAAVGGFVRGPGATFMAGRRVGQGNLEEPMAARFAAGQMRWYEQAPYLLGQYSGMGSARAGVNMGRNLLQRGLGTALASPFMAARTIMGAQREMYLNAPLPQSQRSAPILGGVGNLARAAMSPRAFFAGLRAGGGAEDLKAAGAMRDPEDFGKALRRGVENIHKHNSAVTESTSVTKRLARESALTAGAFVRLEATAVATTAKLGLMAAGGLARRGAVGALGLLGGGNPYIGGAVAAAGAGYFFYNQNKNQGKVEIGESAPIDKYNAALGIATSELGSFTDAVKNATKTLPTPSSFGSVSQVSNDVVSLGRMPKRKMTNDLFDNLKYGSSRAAMMQLMGVDDPRQLQLIQADLVQARGRGQAQKATDIFLNRRSTGAGVDYRALVRDIQGEQGQGLKGKLGYADPTGAKITGAVYESLLGRYGTNAKKYNERFATQDQVEETKKFLGAALPSGYAITEKQKNTAFQAVQGFEKTFLGGEKTGFNAGKFAAATKGMSDKEQGEYFFQNFLANNDNKKVRGYVKDLRSQGVDFGNVTLSQLNQLRRQTDSSYVSGIKGIGALGASALNSGVVQKAVNEPGNANAQYQGIGALLESAKAAGQTLSGTDQQLQRLKAAIGDTTDPLYQLANAAQQLNQAQRAAAMGYQSRTGQLGSSVSNYRAAQTYGGPDQQEKRDQARTELESQKKSYYDYMVSIIQAQKNYAIQMQRAEEDRNRSITRSNRDFYISMQDAAADFYRSRARQERDFQINVGRSQADFARQQKRQAEDAAKGMYDPYRRVAQQWTTSGGGTLLNVRDQNKMIERQNRELRELKKAGLSRQAMDMLDLANPANAQQLSRLNRDLGDDPSAITRLNKQAARREKAAGKLVNSEFSVEFRRQEADFERSMKRAQADFDRGMSDAATDYGISVKRAEAAHGRAMSDMAEDWAIQVDRSKEDLARMSEQVFGSFEEVMDRAIRLVTKNLGKAGTKVREELDKVKESFPELFKDLYDDMVPGGTTSPRVAERRAASNNRTAGTQTSTSGSSTTNVDQSTNVSGTFHVTVPDSKKTAEELANAARVRKLTRAGS